jgi:hypothetical protein
MCNHGLYFFIPSEGIEKDDIGLYKAWYCGNCGKKFKSRDLGKGQRR